MFLILPRLMQWQKRNKVQSSKSRKAVPSFTPIDQECNCTQDNTDINSALKGKNQVLKMKLQQAAVKGAKSRRQNIYHLSVKLAVAEEWLYKGLYHKYLHSPINYLNITQSLIF